MDEKCNMGKFKEKNEIKRNENKCSEKYCTNLFWYAIIKITFAPVDKYPAPWGVSNLMPRCLRRGF